MPQSYLLNRDSDESRRLNEQHDVWVKNLGYQINPQVAKELTPDAKIADVGTGTGIWLLDLAKDHPSWEFHGFDISDAQLQYGHDETSFPNMHFQLADIKQPFPLEFHGKFDLVHVRLMVFALRANDWKTCVAHLKTLLRPGGWIQWEEIDVDPMGSVLRTKLGAKTSCLAEALRSMHASGGQALQDAPKGFRYLRDAFDQNKLKETTEDVVSSERVLELREQATMILAGVIIGVRKQRMADGVDTSDGAEEVKRLTNDITKEIEGGAYLQFYIHCMVGRI